MELYKPSTIRYIQEKYGFKLTKSLGQNFLTDPNIIEKIIQGADITDRDLVIEIGPGIGVITREASRHAARVVAIEIDKNLIPVLNETMGGCPNFKVVNQDVLKTDINELIESNLEELREADFKLYEKTGGEDGQRINLEEKPKKAYKVKIIGNLPYYITTPIIMKLLEEGVKAESVTCMMQKEVADRIKAGPGTKDYGALSVSVQYYCEVEKVCAVPKEVFVPRPKIDSTVLRLDIRKEKAVSVDNDDVFFEAVKAGFGMRRKTLLNSLSSMKDISRDQVKAVLEVTGIDASRRAETLSIDEFAALSNEINKVRSRA